MQLFHSSLKYRSSLQPSVSLHKETSSCNTQQEIPVVMFQSASTCGLLSGHIFLLFPFQHDLRLWENSYKGAKNKTPNSPRRLRLGSLISYLAIMICSKIIRLKHGKKRARCFTTCSAEILPLIVTIYHMK